MSNMAMISMEMSEIARSLAAQIEHRHFSRPAHTQ